MMSCLQHLILYSWSIPGFTPWAKICRTFSANPCTLFTRQNYGTVNSDFSRVLRCFASNLIYKYFASREVFVVITYQIQIYAVFPLPDLKYNKSKQLNRIPPPISNQFILPPELTACIWPIGIKDAQYFGWASFSFWALSR